MQKNKVVVESKPFSWNDKMADLAIEDFESIRADLPYCQCQSIGLALAKLKMIEKGELIINPKMEFDNDLISRKTLIDDMRKRSYINKALCEIFETVVDDAPTAYEVDAVQGKRKKKKKG